MKHQLLAAAAVGLLFGPVDARPNQPCSRIVERQKVVFSQLDKNGDGKVTRREFQPIIDMMQRSAEKAYLERGALSDPSNFEEEFTVRDRHHRGYITFNEFLGGVCKNGKFVPTHIPWPRD